MPYWQVDAGWHLTLQPTGFPAICPDEWCAHMEECWLEIRIGRDPGRARRIHCNEHSHGAAHTSTPSCKHTGQFRRMAFSTQVWESLISAGLPELQSEWGGFSVARLLQSFQFRETVFSVFFDCHWILFNTLRLEQLPQASQWTRQKLIQCVTQSCCHSVTLSVTFSLPCGLFGPKRSFVHIALGLLDGQWLTG